VDSWSAFLFLRCDEFIGKTCPAQLPGRHHSQALMYIRLGAAKRGDHESVSRGWFTWDRSGDPPAPFWLIADRWPASGTLSQIVASTLDSLYTPPRSAISSPMFLVVESFTFT